MLAKQIIINAPGATGNQAYTGIGFQGKLLIIHAVARPNGNTHTGDSAPASLMVGAAKDSTHRWVHQGVSANASATANVQNSRSVTGVICVRTAGGTLQLFADFVSWDADGFTLNWSTIAAGDTAREFVCTVIGGSDVSVDVGTGTAGAATGNKAYTGVGFQPNTLIIVDSRLNTTESSSNTFWRPQMGFADSAGNMGAWGGNSHDAVDPTATASIQSTGDITIGTGTTSGAVDRRATLVSYNADGFTLNWSNVDFPSSFFGYIALNVPFSKVGNVAQRTTNGTTDVPTAGFVPEVIILGGDGTTSTSGGTADHRGSLGIATSVAEQAVVSHHDKDAVATSDSSSGYNTASILRWITANSTTPSVLIAAAISAITNGQFTLNYTDTDGTARKVIYLAMGNATDIKSINGLAKESNKTIKGLALNLVKSFNGLS